MNTICRPETDIEYPISLNIDVNKYNNTQNGKLSRCNSIDEALDAMYPVFKRAAYNRSEPLDFSVIRFYPKSSSNDFYNLTDLINTSWIKSDTQIEHICKITNSVKDYAAASIRNSSALDRDDKSRVGYLTSVYELVDRLILEPYFGLSRRIYWESNNRYEMVYQGISNQVGNFRHGVGRGYNRLSSMVWGNRLSTNSSSSVPVKQAGNTKSFLNASSSSTTTTTTSTTTSAPLMSSPFPVSASTTFKPIKVESKLSNASASSVL